MTLDELVSSFSTGYPEAARQLAVLKANAMRPPDMASALEEIETLRKEIDRLHVLQWEVDSETDLLKDSLAAVQYELKLAQESYAEVHNGLVDQIQESVQLELFWKRCAEQALRLWEQAQDELETWRDLTTSEF